MDGYPDNMVPSYVELVERLPRSVLGRVQKQELRDWGVTRAMSVGFREEGGGDGPQGSPLGPANQPR